MTPSLIPAAVIHDVRNHLHPDYPRLRREIEMHPHTFVLQPSGNVRRGGTV